MITRVVYKTTDFHEGQFSVPGKGGRDAAIRHVKTLINTGEYSHAVCADVRGFFDHVQSARLAIPQIPSQILLAAMSLPPGSMATDTACRDRHSAQTQLSHQPRHSIEDGRCDHGCETAALQTGSDEEQISVGDGNVSEVEGGQAGCEYPVDCVHSVRNASHHLGSENDAMPINVVRGPVGLPTGAICASAIADAVMAKILCQLPVVPVSYVDDLVVLCRSEEEARLAEARISEALGASPAGPLQPKFVSIHRVERAFSFLGYRLFTLHGECWATPMKKNWRKIEVRLRKRLRPFAQTGEPTLHGQAIRAWENWIVQFSEWENAEICKDDRIDTMEIMSRWCDQPATSNLEFIRRCAYIEFAICKQNIL